MTVHATGLLVGRRLAQEVIAFADQAELVVLPPPCPLSVQATDFGHAERLIDQARTDARRHLDRWQAGREVAESVAAAA